MARTRAAAGIFLARRSILAQLGTKHFELLHELLPTASKIVSLLNPGNPNANAYTVQTQAATDALGLRLQVLTAHTEADLGAAFGTTVQQRADALAVIADPFFIARLGVSRLSRLRPATQYPRFILSLTSPNAAG